jgi:HB1, ASXL, restriction endonuclease HTH domain
MANENLISTLEQSLRQSRAARARLAGRLVELEAEAETVRAELAEMDTLASQTEAAIFRLLSNVLSASTAPVSQSPSDAELEAAMRHDTVKISYAPRPVTPRHHIPPVKAEIEIKSDRFIDRTIPHATTMLLREAGEPLHVNEIYNRLLEGGFNFTGHNPTISIAVSLNRNGRFRKVAPGTFDLVMRDASQAS